MRAMRTGLSQHLELTEQIISACHEVHNVLGPGLEERFYRDALAHELDLRGMLTQREKEFSVQYKGKNLGIHRVDLVVDGKVLVELKAVAGSLMKIHVTQTISERRVSDLRAALLVNFGDSSVQVRCLEARES